MFDNPLAHNREPAGGGKPARWFVVAVFLAVCLGFWGVRAPSGPVAVFASPSHLQQVEVVDGPGELVFYVHHAGYRLLHHRELIAVVRGAGAWSVTWEGAEAVRIGLGAGWVREEVAHPAGLGVRFGPV
jgi:hypothetical protein